MLTVSLSNTTFQPSQGYQGKAVLRGGTAPKRCIMLYKLCVFRYIHAPRRHALEWTRVTHRIIRRPGIRDRNVESQEVSVSGKEDERWEHETCEEEEEED